MPIFNSEFRERDYIAGTMWRYITDYVRYRPYRHWGTGVYAAEGLRTQPGSGDRSGCVRTMPGTGEILCRPPTVVQARHYYCETTQRGLSAVHSYPGGIGYHRGHASRYFWEIYPIEDNDIERFGEEGAMELRILDILCKPLDSRVDMVYNDIRDEDDAAHASETDRIQYARRQEENRLRRQDQEMMRQSAERRAAQPRVNPTYGNVVYDTTSFRFDLSPSTYPTNWVTINDPIITLNDVTSPRDGETISEES